MVGFYLGLARAELIGKQARSFHLRSCKSRVPSGVSHFQKKEAAET
jgi:hypothetical protein